MLRRLKKLPRKFARSVAKREASRVHFEKGKTFLGAARQARNSESLRLAQLASQELQFLNGLQSNLGKSTTLADAAGYQGDPGYFKTEYEKQLAVTPDDVKRVANKYLTPGRIVLSIVPQGKPELASKPDQSQRIK